MRDRARRRVPGSVTSTFKRGGVPGSIGQYILYDLPADHAFNPRVDLPEKFGIPDLLWVAGDGNVPTIGPALANVGALPAGVTPHQLDGGDAVPSEEYDGVSYRSTAVSIDPAAGEDVVIAGVVNLVEVPNNRNVISTRVGASRYIRIQRFPAGAVTLRLDVNGDANTFIDVPWAPNSIVSFLALINRDGNLTLFVNNVVNSAFAATPAGDIGTAAGVGIGADQNGTRPIMGGILWLSWWNGAGLNEVWTADASAKISELLARSQGTYPLQGGLNELDRDSAASWQNRNGVWFIASDMLPRAGDATAGGQSGVRIAPQRENECHRNIDTPQFGACNETGGVGTVVDDSVALLAAGCQAWGPDVYQLVNATGVVQYVRCGDQTGDTNDRSLSVLARITAGAGVDIGLYDESAGTFDGTPINDGYATRTLDHGRTPGDTDCRWALRIQDGVTVRWIAQQMEEGPTTTTIIPVYTLAATATRLAEVLTMPDTPFDEGGGVQFGITSMDWASGDLGVASRIIERSGGVTLLVSINAAGAVEATDGTTQVGTATLDDGVRRFVKCTWGDAGLRLEVDGVVEVVAYDGALPSAGTFAIEATVGEVAIDSFQYLREQSGI